jgi:hypothetical protein
MSSSGINSINSGPLIIRTYLDNSVNNTYLLGKYDYPVSSNRVLITSTGGLLAPSDNITISTINVSTLNAIDINVLNLVASTISTTSIRDINGSLGNPGDTLHTDGNTVYWAPDGAGTSFWDSNGTNIYNNNSGNVGINTTTPQSQLDVNGSTNISGGLTVVGSISTFGAFIISSIGSQAAMRMITSGNGNSYIESGSNLSNASGNKLLFTNINAQVPLGVAPLCIDMNNYKVGIGTDNPQAVLHVAERTSNSYQAFTVPNTYTYVIPTGVSEMEFEMVGAGGANFISPNWAAVSGSGGYIKGVVNLSGFAGQTLTIKVGNIGAYSTPSPASAEASYLSINGLMLVMAGAGGQLTALNAFVTLKGGGGGGGNWNSISGNQFVADGIDGEPASGLPGLAGFGGTSSGGGAGGSGSGLVSGQSGANQAGTNPNYTESSGGISLLIPDYVQSCGGNGWTGGGAGAMITSPEVLGTGGGGGGSSYYNGNYVTLINSVNGTDYTTNPLIPGYGTSGKGGYVSITFLSSEPAIVTNGAVGIGLTEPYIRLQTVVDNPTALEGISAKSGDVNTIIGAYSEGIFGPPLFVNAGSIQVTHNNQSYDTWPLTLNPRGGDIYIGSSISNSYVLSDTLDCAKKAISRQIVTSTIISAGPTTLDSGFFGKYIFVDPNIGSATTIDLPNTAPEGTVVIIRNLMTSFSVTIGGPSIYTGGTTITSNTAASYVFTTYAGSGGQWVAL